MYSVSNMEVVSLSRDEGVMISWLPEGIGIELAQKKLESLKRQYEAEMEALRQQLEVQRECSDHVDHQLHSQYQQAVSSLRDALQDSTQQKELDAVVGQLQELHQRQLQQLNAKHMHETALQVTAMRVTVEQVQASRLKLLEEDHQNTVQQLNKKHKEQLNALQAGMSSGSASGDGFSALSASEELTQHYQNLVQRINQSLEKEVLERLHGDETVQNETDGANTSDVSADTISKQQAEAIQQALQVQQEEVLSLRSKLLQEYETMLQQRSDGVAQQTQDVQNLQSQMVDLQAQYEKQIAEFQSRINQYNEKEELRQAEQQKHVLDVEELRKKYEKQISEMEKSFTHQISVLEQAAVSNTPQNLHLEPRDVSDRGDSGVVGTDFDETDTEPLSHKMAQERDYIHKTATLTAISDIDSEASESPRTSSELKVSSPSSKLQELQNTVEEKTARVNELEKCLEEEREKMSGLVSQLESSSLKLNDLSRQLEQQTELSEKLQKSLEDKDLELEKVQQESAESQKLLRELTDREKDKDNVIEQEVGAGGETLSTSTPTVEAELKQLRVSLEETTAALRAVEARESELQEKLSDAEHQHTEALEELRQELEHEAQMERETLQSEFCVQLDIELKRQAAELKRQFSEQPVRNGSAPSAVDMTNGNVDDQCAPDVPHSGEDVQAALTESQNFSLSSQTSDNQDLVITDHHVTCQQNQSLQLSPESDKLQNQAGECDPVVHKNGGVLSPPAAVTNGADSSSPCGANAPSSDGVSHTVTETVSKTDFDTQMLELCRQFEAEKAQLVEAHQKRIAELETLLQEAEDKYNSLKEAVEEGEGAGVDTLLKDRYDMELELAKNLMQQEFDDTLQTEKKKFVERHRQLMDDFMSERETEAAEIKQKHDQELEGLRLSLSAQYDTQMEELRSTLNSQYDTQMEELKSTLSAQYDSEITQLQTELKNHQDANAAQNDQNGTEEDNKGKEDMEELNALKNELQEVKEELEVAKSKHTEGAAALLELEDVKTNLEMTRSQLTEAMAAVKQLEDAQEALEKLKADHAKALAALTEEHEARISEITSKHQEELEAVALDTDVMKSELEQAHHAEVKQLKDQIYAQAASQTSTASKETGAVKLEGHQAAECNKPGPEAMHAVSEISLPLPVSYYKSSGQSFRDGERTPDVRSSLEYEETDEEGSVKSFSSLLGKTRSFADAVKSTPPTSPRQDERIKQLEAQVVHLSQQLAQQLPPETMTATQTTTVSAPPPSAQSTTSVATSPPLRADHAQAEGGDHSLISMLRSDLDRISAERDTIQQTNNRLLQLLSDSVHTYVEVEDTINRRLHSVVAASAARPHTPTHPLRPDFHGDLVTPRGAGLSSFIGVAGDRGAVGGVGMVSSPQSDRSWRQREDNSSPTLEETSILSSATDEGLDVSQRLTESIFTGPDLDAEGEEIVSDARGRLQNAVTRLLEMIERTMQQLLEAKATQTDLLETMAARTRDNNDLSARLHDLEEQVRQEVSAKEYLGLELHKAEGLISGYSSEREALEEQVQSLEEQKEVLASDLETTRSRLQEFQEAAGELEARRLDVERHQSILQENAGQEAQESAMAGGDATVSEQQALLKEVNSVKQETREQTLQLQHRLSQAEQCLQERETTIEEMEKEQQRLTEELRKQVDDLRLQLENTERQLKSNKQFLDEQMTEREVEREEFLKEVEKLKDQLHNKEKQTDSEARLQREIQDLTEQLQARIECQSLMHQQTRQLQQTLQERDLSAQDLRVWIDSLEHELDQRGDTEEQLKGRIQNLERRLTIGGSDKQSDESLSPQLTPRADSPTSLLMSPTRPGIQRRESRISLEDELRRSRRAEEELVHEKEALQKRVQEQLLQISALRNQLDEMRHWTGPTEPNVSSSSAADLREQLDTEREKLEKVEEELSKANADQEKLQKELQERTQEVEHVKQQLHDSVASASRITELEEERKTLQSRIAELSDAGPFPPELLDEKNAEIEELRQQLSKTKTDYGSLQAELKEKEELVSDLQDTVHSLQRGEACLDVSLPFNEPVPLNLSFTERTSLAQELDQTMGEREARIAELTAELEQLAGQLTEQQEQLEQLQQDKASLESELHQRDEDLSQLQEEKTQKQEALVEKESRLEQLVEQINSLHTEITSLTTFQVELQKDFDTVQSMLDEKEREIESLTKELLDTRSQTDGSDVSDLEAELAAVQRQLREQRNVVDEKEEELYELNEKLESMEAMKTELQSLKSQLAEKSAQLEQDRKTNAELQEDLSEKKELLEKEAESCTKLQQEFNEQLEQLEREKEKCAGLKQEVVEKTELLEKERQRHVQLQQELEEMQRAERASRSRAQSYPNLNVKPLEDQVSELRAEVFHLEGVVKDKEELIRYLEEEKAADADIKDSDLANLKLQLQETQEKMAAKVAELEKDLQNKQERFEETASQKEEELENLQQQLQSQVDKFHQMETEHKALQDQAEDYMITINSLRREVALLKEQLDELKSTSTATDDAKALQERLQQAAVQVMELQQQMSVAENRLEQTSTQLAEREEQIQQLQTEIQTLHQESQQQKESLAAENHACPRTPDSEDSEADERLKDVLSRVQHVQSLAKDSLSSSLPLSSTAETSNMSRWESEPGLSSAQADITTQAYETEIWLRRQQRELASKNRELATVRQELEAWLRRKDRKTATASEHSASIMTMTLRLQEKELLISSLKRELAESKELLAAAERSAAAAPATSDSQSLSPQTQEQISHLRSELQRAKAALAALQEHSGLDSDVHESSEDREQIEKLQEELRLLRSSGNMSTEDLAKKIQELREELSQEHQRHVHDIQESARQDLEVRLIELQSRHAHETQQLQQLHQHKLEQALSEQQQEMEKRQAAEFINFKLQQQREIDRQRNEGPDSVSDAAVIQQLFYDVMATQEMDQHLIGRLTTNDDHDDSASNSVSHETCPPHIQDLLDRIREAGEHMLSVSGIQVLQHRTRPSQDGAGGGLQQAWEGEKLSFVKTINALKELLSQADRVKAGLEDENSDWRSELIHALVEVYRGERQGLEAELHTLHLQHPGQHVDLIKSFDNRLQEQEQLHQSGLDAMLRAERQSLVSELEDLRTRLSQERQKHQDLQTLMTESLSQQEENASNKTWKLQREVQVLEYKLQQEKIMEEDLKKSLENERRRVADLSSELSHDKGTLISVQSELQSTQLHLSRTKDALEREQNRFNSVTKKQQDKESQLRDALEEEREKNSRLSDMLETLRRQQSSLETDVGRSEAMRRERENADSRFIKELQSELAAERDQVHKMTEVAEEERRQCKQIQAEMERERQHLDSLKQELEKMRRLTKKSLEAEAGKLSESQRLLQKEQGKVQESQRLLVDKDASILQHTNQIQQLQSQVQQLKNKCSIMEQELDTEHQKADSMMTLMDKERQQQLQLQQQELEASKQLRQDLSQAKIEAGEARRNLELEKSRCDNLRLELERAQSELRALTQHAGATERQLETEHSNTWNKLRSAQRERDELQVKVHELELELDRLQDRLQDLELELDRSRQRELEARHDVERHKLYPLTSPRSAPTTPRGTTDIQLQSRLNAFCQQLQGVGQRLQILTLKQRDHNVSVAESEESSAEVSKQRSAVEALMAELKTLQKKMVSGDQVDAVDNSVALTKEVEELQNTIQQLQSSISQIQAEKQELKRQLEMLEEQNSLHTSGNVNTANINSHHQEGMPQYVSDVTTSDDEILYERTVWANERLSLQMALDSAEHEIDRLKKELRSFRGRFNAEGFMVEADRDKMQRLYGKYLRAESFRKALVYQKKYLLLLLGGYQDSEQETLAVIATMGGQPSSTFDLALRRRHCRMYTIFRSAARMVVAIFRMKYLVRKWKRAMRIGSPVVSGRVSQHYGYVATSATFSPANNPERPQTNSNTSAHVHTLTRGGLAAVTNGNAASLSEQYFTSSHPASDAGRRFYTPPTKEFNQSSRTSVSPASSSARRQLMADLDKSQLAASGSDDSGGGGRGAAAQLAGHDDFIQRLENLQSRLSASKNGEASQGKPGWR